MTSPTVAIVYDWVTSPHGGAEKVLLALHEAFPEAPLYTSVYDDQKVKWTNTWPVISSFLQKIPTASFNYRWLAPFMPLAFESLDLSQFDVVISVTSGSAKGVITLPHQLHMCYLLTPPRFLYTHADAYLSHLLQALTSPLIRYLKWWDQVAMHRPDVVITISKLVAKRFSAIYDKNIDEVIYPPIETASTKNSKPENFVATPQKFFLVVSRLVSYKRIDLAIAACLASDWHLVIIGEGPKMSNLLNQAQHHSRIHFLGSQPASVVAWYQQRCQALLMPGVEDFGIVAAETVAQGRPAIVHRESGVAEVLTAKNAVFINDETTHEVLTACQKVLNTTYNQDELRQSVSKYATTTFVKKIKSAVLTHWSKYQEERSI